MKPRRRSPSDLGLELWDFVKEGGEEGLPRETALAHMPPASSRSPRSGTGTTCARWSSASSTYSASTSSLATRRCPFLALNREIELLYRRAVRLHRSSIAPLGESGRQSPQLLVAHTALAGMIEAAAPLRHASFSADVVVRHGTSP